MLQPRGPPPQGAATAWPRTPGGGGGPAEGAAGGRRAAAGPSGAAAPLRASPVGRGLAATGGPETEAETEREGRAAGSGGVRAGCRCPSRSLTCRYGAAASRRPGPSGLAALRRVPRPSRAGSETPARPRPPGAPCGLLIALHGQGAALGWPWAFARPSVGSVSLLPPFARSNAPPSILRHPWRPRRCGGPVLGPRRGRGWSGGGGYGEVARGGGTESL